MSHADDHEGTRRDFLYYATAGAGTVAVGAATLPLIHQMNPSLDVQALSSIRVDVGGVEPGTQVKVIWQGKPVFIRRRTADEIDAANDVDLADLPDNNARNKNARDGADGADANRFLASPTEGGIEGEWLVMVGVCTHLGCVPLGNGSGEFGGWFCPCHGSHYDTAGRVRKGPAPENLAVPPARFDDETTIVFG